MDDESIIELLEHAEYRGDEFGYVVSALAAELGGEETRLLARRQADMAIQTVIRMHAFVIEKYGLKHSGNYGVGGVDGCFFRMI